MSTVEHVDDIVTNNEQTENKETKQKEPTYDENELCLIDRGYGLIIGGGIGDALGQFVEFSFTAISEETMQIVLSMPGEGGTWNDCCTKGQITDDTEMGMALTYALLNMKAQHPHKFDVQHIASEYYKWQQSGPFDLGKTAFAVISHSDKGKNAAKMIQRAKQYNVEMKEKYRGLGGVRSNGSLMRIMPLILYCCSVYSAQKEKNYDEIFEIVRGESALTHYNQVVFHGNMAYCVAGIYLLQHSTEKDRNKNAYLAAKQWLLSQLKRYYDLQENLQNGNEDEKEDEDEEDTLEMKIACCTEVLEWIYNACEYEVNENGDDVYEDEHCFSSTTKMIGHVKIALERAFFYLYNGYEYKVAMQEVIGSGGDTDTNACIVGALLGCYYGLQALREQTKQCQWAENIEQCVPKIDFERRKVYQPRLYLDHKLVERLLSLAE